ncbi:hypothetical protein PYW07_002992 [Mythimna separata]|uniref:Fibrillin-2-like n=1 Tax=Mythimna separata TaxID=271217 RepID=A0AAD7YGS1_MYTSE|nr:hypothetical protein PYW07_002992 [Mythimna separata]
MGDGSKMTMWRLVAAAALLCACAHVAAGEARGPQPTRPPRLWPRAPRTLSERKPNQFVGPHVCRSRNSTHCCPGWTSRPNSLLCIVPLCRPDCGSPGACVAPNMCRCASGVEAPSCGGGGLYPYPVRTPGGCRRICMNGGTCSNGTCSCAPGWSGEFCTEPICREPCLHGGRCIAPDRCVCFHGLSGTRCEIDRRTGPCYTDTRGALCTGALEGVVCTKQLCCATVGVAWGHPCERCGDLDCPTGHLRNLATKECQDIDECAAVPGLCQGGRCINSIGSFSCECPPGQRRHRVTNNCEDIDECEDPDICPNGKCVNTEGDYYCLCNPHFIPSPDKKFCIDGRVGSCFTYMSETGECADRLPMPLSNRDCCCGYNMGRAWGDMCTPCPPRGSTEWTHLCGGGVIPPNWRRNVTGGGGDGEDGGGGGSYEPPAIAKINECMLRNGICGLGTCVDKDKGYQCDCWDGAESVVQDGNPTCIDIDECALEYCKGGSCINRPGGFDCRCPPGFDPIEGGLRCSDKNECESTHGGMCTNGVCRNIDGEYECVCNPGYESTETGHACRDVDECRDNPRVCRRGRCRNTPGSYECECEPGFSITAGGYCTDIDECSDKSVCQGGRCVNSEGSFQCVCEAGYRPTPDRGACIDVNECSEQRVCRNGRCHNTPGSFRCECLPGFSLSNDGRTCLDEVQDLCYEKYEEGHCTLPGQNPVTRSQCCCSSSKGLHLGWGVACKSCPERGSKEYDILCPEGASKDNGGTDINECTMIPGICPHGTCENLEPGYKCICDPGFHPDDDGICRDIDECDMHQSYCTGGQCRNTLGSFTCVCPPGTRYEPDEQICRDIDECEEQSNPCDNGRCINSHGSYECECENGFVLDATAQHCIDNRRGSCWRRVVDGQCEAAARQPLLRQECCCSVGLAWGSPCEPCEVEHCPCPKGFAKLDGATCRDVDECQLDSELCVGGTCVNTDGSYRCECPPGLTLDATGNHCLDTRREYCYTDFVGGRCSSPLQIEVLKAVCCCSSLGKAWGDHRCEPCPKKGTDSFRNLCIAEGTGPHGPTIWDRPGDTGNGTVIWGGDNHGGGTHGGGSHGGGGGTGGGAGDDYDWGEGNGDNWGNTTGDNWHKVPGGPGVVPGQMEVNECAAFPGLCGHGRCRNLVGTFTCDCFPGYEKDSKNHTCVDVNECEIVDGVCGSGECRNTEGSFTCHCHPGHKADDFSKVCVDIDECAETRGLCRGGRCINTPGSFRCECGPGMELSPDRLSCKDVDECSITSGICSNGACENLMGTYQCVCDEGYAQSTVKSHCEDIDECTEDPTRCQHECVNTPGSYHCTCRDGWHLRADGRTCRDIDECGRGARPCGGGECRNTPGSYVCTCADGLLPSPDGAKPTCQDIDECADVPDLCGAGECHNTIGSFVCRCPDGYSVKPEQGPACTDDDECELGTCDCHPAADCINLPGSFQCRCRDGWRGDGTECEDIDECLTNNGGCHPRATCTNTDGSFMCLCDTGYKGDGYSCVDIDECANDPTLCENGHCTNTPGGYECDCDVGFTKSPDGRSCLGKSHSYSCVDIDECANDPTLCENGHCTNTPGGYECDCDVGFTKSPDGRSCLGKSHSYSCVNIDECANDPTLCENGHCTNTPGGYECDCDVGFTKSPDGRSCLGKSHSYSCVNIDECANDPTLCENGHCTNTPGGYECDCDVGFTKSPDGRSCLGKSHSYSCVDIDECANDPTLCENGHCTNTPGGYECDCDVGFTKSPDGRSCLGKSHSYSCVDIDECANDPTLCENGHCTNTPGGYECDCDVGFTKSPDGRSCLDMDECATFDNVCVFGRCVNTYGMFKCICDKGYQSDSIDDLMPGFNCTDVDECKSPQSCQYGQCINTQGSYICRCPPNYELVSDGTACYDSRKARCYGKVDLKSGAEHCRDSDELSEDGTMAACCCSVGAAWGNYCDLCPEPGSEAYRQLCPGGPGYQPVLEPPSYVVTLADIDECAQHPALCEHGTCTNTFGSFVCTCGDGWQLTADEQRCEDIDECARPDICGPGICRNMQGSYVCLCPEGYVAMPNGKECVDVRQRQCYMDWEPDTGRCTGAAGVPQTKYLCCCSVGKAWGAPCEPCPDKGSHEHMALCGEKPGEYINPMTNETKPINECDIMPQLCKPGTCHDTPTGFQCGCDHGYEHDNTSHLCRDVDECALHRTPCRGLAQCVNLPGAYECRCPPGYRLTASLDECEDVDECADERLCEHGECRNTIGSYRCDCKPGYTLRDSVCRDVDECSRPRPMCRNGTCENLPGSYMCHCDEGFKPGANNDCIDINECREGGMVCRNGRCRNTVGSFRCECAPGYALTADARHCRDVDECSELPHPCGRDGSPSCTNTNGGYECSCGAGWRLVGRRCVDRDECKEIQYVCAGGECRNFNGGYVCDCPTGWRFDKAAAICVDERKELCYDEWESGRCHRARPLQLGRPECCCSEGAAWGRYCERCPAPDSPEFLRICQGGMGRPNLTQDLDECKVRPDVCKGGRCINTDGSFRCECPPGYTLNPTGLVCVDADECAADPRICGNGTCTNTPGGYECRCNFGFTQGPEQTCVDIDECMEGRALCTFRCHNTAGSFRCTCPYGYAVAADGVHCRDIDECAQDNKVCPHACENVVGSYICKCPEGYRRTSSAHDAPDACEDIDECSEDPDRCSPGVCINTEGGFACDCDAGYQPSDDGMACIGEYDDL